MNSAQVLESKFFNIDFKLEKLESQMGSNKDDSNNNVSRRDKANDDSQVDVSVAGEGGLRMNDSFVEDHLESRQGAPSQRKNSLSSSNDAIRRNQALSTRRKLTD